MTLEDLQNILGPNYTIRKVSLIYLESWYQIRQKSFWDWLHPNRMVVSPPELNEFITSHKGMFNEFKNLNLNVRLIY